MKYVIAYDLGTGGIKTGIYGEDGVACGFCFSPYEIMDMSIKFIIFSITSVFIFVKKKH